MTRPFYENESDRAKEREVIDLFCNQFGFTAEKFKPSLVVDYGLLKGGHLTVVAEVKVRKEKFPSMFISLDKVQHMRNYVAWGVKARVIFALPDGVYVQKLDFSDGPQINFDIGINGRKDRDDPQDREPVVYFPVDGMTRLFDSKPEWFQ